GPINLKTRVEWIFINIILSLRLDLSLSYLSWSWALDQLLQLDNDAKWESLEPKKFGESLMIFCSAHERCEVLNQKDKLGVWSLLNAKKTSA
ncbi:MAG: hypothetical protein RLZ10_818, partial [Bacteroidota bacterium]